MHLPDDILEQVPMKEEFTDSNTDRIHILNPKKPYSLQNDMRPVEFTQSISKDVKIKPKTIIKFDQNNSNLEKNNNNDKTLNYERNLKRRRSSLAYEMRDSTKNQKMCNATWNNAR